MTYLQYKCQKYVNKIKMLVGGNDDFENTVEKIDDTLFVGNKKREHGLIYFAFEKIDESNIGFWKFYAQQARICSANFAWLSKNGNSYPNMFTDQLKVSQQDFLLMRQTIINKGWDKSATIFGEDGIRGGINGMDSVLSKSMNDMVRYVVYISTDPVTQRHSDKNIDKTQDFDTYKKLFGQIVMSMGFVTKNDSPTTTHHGIFKNPLFFFDDDKLYAGIAMDLHGFSAKVALKFNPKTNGSVVFEKRYMINSPTSSMIKIILEKISQQFIHLGISTDYTRNLDINSKQLIEKYPPIQHFYAGIYSLAKHDVDLSKYVNEPLPEKLTEYRSNGRFIHVGDTIGALDTAIDLVGLQKLF